MSLVLHLALFCSTTAATPVPMLLHGEVVADRWPLEPLTTAPESTSYHRGLTGFSLGNHRVDVIVADGSYDAMVAKVKWRRRPTYGIAGVHNGPLHRLPQPEKELPTAQMQVVGIFPSETDGAEPLRILTNVTVLNSTSDGALIAFQPELGAGKYEFYYMPVRSALVLKSFKFFSPNTLTPKQYFYTGGDGSYRVTYGSADSFTACPVVSDQPTSWRNNTEDAWPSPIGPARTIVPAGQSAAVATNLPWKTVDNKFNFSAFQNPSECISKEGKDVCEGYDGPQGVEQLIFDLGECAGVDALALWAVGDGRHDPQDMIVSVSNSSMMGWRQVSSFRGQGKVSSRQQFTFETKPMHVGRFWRLTINNRCCLNPVWQAWIREIQFRVTARGSIPSLGGRHAWIAEHGLSRTTPGAVARAAALPTATVTNYSARTRWDRFNELEVRASSSEVEAALENVTGPAAVVIQNRRTPIRMLDALPLLWTTSPQHQLEDVAAPAEVYVWQVGVWALEDLQVVGFSAVGASNVTCFNLGGTTYKGKRFTQVQTINASTLGALSFALRVPSVSHVDLELTLHYNGSRSSRALHLRLNVSGDPLPAGGTKDSWRLARMGWLNSVRGLDNDISKGYEAMTVDQARRRITLLHRSVTLGPDGLPISIIANGIELLQAPVTFGVGSTALQVADATALDISQEGPGLVTWTASSAVGHWHISVKGSLSYEGFSEYNCTIQCTDPTTPCSTPNVTLTVPYKASSVRWAMGLHFVSGAWPVRLMSNVGQPLERTRHVVWPWQGYGGVDKRSSAWLGTPDAGLRVKLKGQDDSWNSPVELPTVAAKAWGNCRPGAKKNCSGAIEVVEDGDAIVFRASTGTMTLASGQALPFSFDMLATPLKTLNTTQHFDTRYYHFGGPVPVLNLTMDEYVLRIKALNVSWVVIHQGSNLNPYINYPLREDLAGVDQLGEFVSTCHEHGLRVKLYFTTRELTNRASELPLLKALPNHEIIFGGRGGGGAWLQEHLSSDYSTAWSQVAMARHNPGAPSLNGLPILADEAVHDSGYSRWNNFYVEAVNHMINDFPKADGLYLDGIAFERTTLRRVRRGMEAAKTDIRVDIHDSNGGGCRGPGWGVPALQFMQHFAFADSLWFGEGFDYWGQDADWWLLESSGIPWGLTGDMIRETQIGPNGTHNKVGCPDPNRWLGMVFGMTARLHDQPLSWWGQESVLPLSVSAVETVPLWRIGLEFGLSEAKMIGWWSAPSELLVHSSDVDVKATVFLKPDGESALIALGNFANETKHVTLTAASSTANWTALTADAIEGFQPASVFELGTPFAVDAKRGWLLRCTIK